MTKITSKINISYFLQADFVVFQLFFLQQDWHLPFYRLSKGTVAIYNYRQSYGETKIFLNSS